VDKVHLGPQNFRSKRFQITHNKKKLNFPGLLQMFAKNGCLLKEGSAKMKYLVFKDV